MQSSRRNVERSPKELVFNYLYSEADVTAIKKYYLSIN